ncbi:MAG: hypothetical protein R3C18_08775 [Planctomycetaceae bacterium]
MMGRSLIAGLLFATFTASLFAAPPRRPISNPKFDPDAKQMDLFEAMEEGVVDAKMVAKNSLGGNLIITNNQAEPITVKIPQGFVGVPGVPMVSAQFGQGGFGGGQGGFGGGFGGQQGGLQGGQNQSIGGGQGLGQGSQLGGAQGGQQNFFSIPAERAVIVPYKSVCLEHGKAEPNVRVQYTPVPVEKFTNNVALQELIKQVGSGRMDQGAAQAAAWHIANGMSWQQLANKKYDRLGAPDTPYFSQAQMAQAQQIVAAAEYAAKTAPAAEKKETEPGIRQTVRTSR